MNKELIDNILHETYDKIYRDFYKTQQPKKGRPKKVKA